MNSKKRLPVIILGPALFAVVFFLPLEIDLLQKLVLGVAFWMASWWISEAAPLHVTSLIPLVLFPLLGIESLDNVIFSYLDEIVLLFLGGFLLAKAIERSKLHKRFALNLLRLFGTRPKYVIGSFIIITASLSAWMTNTATTLLMLPIAIAIISQIKDADERSKFGACLMLCVAYSASMGGLATLIGTPPNALFASLSESLTGIEVSFAQWMIIGVPISAISLVVLWYFMVNFAKLGRSRILGTKQVVTSEILKLGKMEQDEKILAIIFGCTVTALITRGLFWKDFIPFVEDYFVVLLAVIVLMIIPSSHGRILDVKSTSKIPWDVLILIGGGLALAGGFTSTGLDLQIAQQLSFVTGLDYFLIILLIVTVTIFSGELMSNTAGAALLLPIMASLSTTMNIHPLLLMAPVAVATSYGFIMPVATPPNAIVLGSKYITTKKMARFGLPLNIISVLLVSVLTVVLVPLIWG